MPYQIGVEPGTILIDSTLTEQDNRGRENFTVMHEVFHQVLHKKCFRGMPKNYVHPTSSRTIDGNIRYASYALAMIEKQANACAAAFLMPAELTGNTYKQLYTAAGLNRYNNNFVYNTIKEMAEEFSVSWQAMSIRLQTLGLINADKENLYK
jgi:Zn-dependent peptidase ImmA (M78 family)